MGLEATNFIFTTDRDLKALLAGMNSISQLTDKYYVYKEDEKYWIDLELMNNNELSIRITMCNPLEEVTSFTAEELYENIVSYDGKDEIFYLI